MDTNDVRTAINYYHMKIQETNDPYYWYCLADMQARAGMIGEALNPIDNARLMTYPYPLERELVNMQENLQNGSSRQNRPTVITEKRGDVNGDGMIDTVFLTGNKTPDSPFWQNITLVIQNGRTNQYQQIVMKNNAGYNPTLFLGDFTGDKINDILVVIDSGGSGGTIYAYVFAHRNGRMRQIFDSDTFNEGQKYGVSYEDYYRASVISYSQNKKYILDLTYKGKEYLAEIYNANGTLKEPIEGWVNPISGLYPIDFNRDGTYELQAYQRIAGRYNADGLGFVQAVLTWNGRGFVIDRQNVAIVGGDN
ncbi:VCBS repeat-containing protein [Metabacillus litoralis]|nr:VCBS repeat-containing protein [Metabacillus litoralis]MCM3653799.1 VCBS repeat-containing protein [Metabacillus litoralis]